MNTVKLDNQQQTLGTLLAPYADVRPEHDVNVVGITLDSREVRPGDLFLAIPGGATDGRHYIDEVLQKKAAAVLVEAGPGWESAQLMQGIPVIPVTELGNRAGCIAARFHGDPARKLRMIGITGTNGKTSCSQFIAQALEHLGHSCGICGTLGYGLFGQMQAMGGQSVPGTTPDAVTLQRILREMCDAKAEFISMEVSSHALEQRRVNPADFELALFTNLSRDHLDYHGTMENYGAAKRKLFTSPQLKVAVVNQDDQYASKILNALATGVRAYTYSLSDPGARIHARDVRHGPDGSSANIITPWGRGVLKTALLGSFNMSNLVGVLTSVLALEADKPDFSFTRVLEAVAAVKPVPGRMETLSDGTLMVVVDYAHTPDALRNALTALREHYSDGSVWCVFGCGGNRDRGKRPLMAEAAEALADNIIITDDNPRTEASMEIIQQILLGISDKQKVAVINDRAKAIEHAILNAEPGDVVLIAGKGHEQYQDVGGSRMAFSDVSQARLSLNKRVHAPGRA